MLPHASTIFFDNNATTAIAPECFAAMQACLRLGPLNPSSKHSLGDQARQLVADARARVADFVGAVPAEVVFTSGGTESNHAAILGALALRPGRRGIVTSEVEHPAVLMLLRHLQTQGMRVSFLPVDEEGRIDLDALRDTVNGDTALVTLMWANNETGVVFPIVEASEIAHSHGAVMHTDAVQAIGKSPLDFRFTGADLLSLSGHKLHAPSGIGALLVRKDLKLPPLQFGQQERGRRGGTENVSGIVALGVACHLIKQVQASDTYRMENLRNRLEAGILRSVPFATVNGGRAKRVANTSNIRFGDCDAETVLGRLDRLGILASAGAACASAGKKPSHVLTAMGLSAKAALASIRFSLGRHNTEAEVDVLLRVLPRVLEDAMGGISSELPSLAAR
jgi:cysteine desulfurase